MGTPTDPTATQPSLSTAPPALRAALSALDAAQVRWCLLRGADDLAHSADDVDLLVHPADMVTLTHTVARAAGFEPMPAWGRAPHRFFVTAAGGTRIKLDVVTRLAFGRHGELHTEGSIAGLVLASRRRIGELYVPAPADAFWALLLHAILDRRVVRDERGAEIRALATRADGGSPLAGVLDAACPLDWDAARVLDAAAAGSFDELLALARRLRSNWPQTTRTQLATRVAASRVLRRADRSRPVRATRARAARSAQSSGLMTSNSRLRSTG